MESRLPSRTERLRRRSASPSSGLEGQTSDEGSNENPGKNRTFDIMIALRRIIDNENALQYSGLCHTGVVHCASNWRDLGWGCGYRNTQQVLSSLLAVDPDRYDEVFGASDILSIREIQAGIEEAWRKGYDIEGAGQLHWKLVGTKKWIGTTEVYAFLTEKGLDVDIIQFDGQSPASKLMQFCRAYFELPSGTPVEPKVIISSRHPLYFQHQGHSRTIVGFIQTLTGSVLLVFDPAKRVSDDTKQLVLGEPLKLKGLKRLQTGRGRLPDWSKMLKTWKIDENSLKRKEYQLLRINGYLATDQHEKRKIIRPCVF